MCKIQEAILAMSKKHDNKKIAIALGHAKIIGTLKTDEEDSYEGIIGLKDAHIHCHKTDKIKEVKCIGISTHAIEAFTFDTSCECK